jgi:copper chaperone CopZ
MISYSFYNVYGPPSRREHACCKTEAEKQAHARNLTVNRTIVWASLAVAVTGATYGRVSLPNSFRSASKSLWKTGTGASLGGAAGAGGISSASSSSSLLKFHVEGMTCGGCANKVQKAIESTGGVQNVVVDHKTGEAVVEGVDDQVNEDNIKNAVAQAGYTAGR